MTIELGCKRGYSYEGSLISKNALFSRAQSPFPGARSPRLIRDRIVSFRCHCSDQRVAAFFRNRGAVEAAAIAICLSARTFCFAWNLLRGRRRGHVFQIDLLRRSKRGFPRLLTDLFVGSGKAAAAEYDGKDHRQKYHFHASSLNALVFDCNRTITDRNITLLGFS